MKYSQQVQMSNSWSSVCGTILNFVELLRKKRLASRKRQVEVDFECSIHLCFWNSYLCSLVSTHKDKWLQPTPTVKDITTPGSFLGYIMN